MLGNNVSSLNESKGLHTTRFTERNSKFRRVTFLDEAFNEQLPSDLGSSSDSSPQVFQAINAHTQPTEISDDMLRNNVSSLNEKQRSAYNIALYGAEILLKI